jgi:hypothetical protein
VPIVSISDRRRRCVQGLRSSHVGRPTSSDLECAETPKRVCGFTEIRSWRGQQGFDHGHQGAPQESPRNEKHRGDRDGSPGQRGADSRGAESRLACQVRSCPATQDQLPVKSMWVECLRHTNHVASSCRIVTPRGQAAPLCCERLRECVVHVRCIEVAVHLFNHAHRAMSCNLREYQRRDAGLHHDLPRGTAVFSAERAAHPRTIQRWHPSSPD